MMKKWIALLLAFAMLWTLTACGDDPVQPERPAVDAPAAEDSAPEQNEQTVQDSWAIYWYLCGSDLETNHGCATTDLQEMLQVQLPDNVKVVIQTGGAAVWQNELMDPGKIQRWLYSSEGLQLLEEQPAANMGEAQTLYDFLYFADANYPADRVAVTFWNHGGGSVSGAAFDEIYGNDSLDLVEMYQAFDAVWPANVQSPALELIGFDTCLMATVDVASAFRNFAKYLVASEEVEPGNGWVYSGWIGALAADPAMDGEDLGVAICNTFYEGCEAVGTEEQVTLSLTDLTRLEPLLEAYERFGQEALAAAAADPGFFAELGRTAAQTENYGGNTREQGYTNMVDMGHLARQTAWMLPAAQDVSDALENCVVYQVGGIYRSEATGLSCYYSYSGDVDDFLGYANVGTGTAFKHLYAYGLTGELSEGGEDYLASLEIGPLPERLTLPDMGWDGAPLEVDEDGTACLYLGPDANALLSRVAFSLFYVDEENDLMLLLGSDNDLTADWENGIFYDNFRGVWGAIDGSLVYMELSFEGEDYNQYSVPVLLNGEPYNLQVVYDFTLESWEILGAIPGIDQSGMASKEIRLLEEGDVITTIWEMSSFSGDDDFEMVTVEEIVVTADTAFAEAPLFDGEYAMFFELWDAAGNMAWSAPVFFTCTDGEIYTNVY